MESFLEDGAAIEYSPHDRDIVFTAGFIYLSPTYWFQTSVTTDGGATWRRDTVEPQRRARAVAFDLGNPNRVYLGGDSSYSYPMFKISTDLGLTWTESHSGLSGGVATIATVPGSPNILYCGTSQGLFKSTDAGTGWNRQGSMNAVRAVVVDTVDTHIVYAGTASGVFVTTDAGASWSPFNDGLTSTDILALELHSGPGGKLFAGTNGRGMFSISAILGIETERTDRLPGNAAPGLQPNPCRDRTVLRLGAGLRGSVQVSVHGASGRRVASWKATIDPGAAGLVLDVSRLPAGVYLVRLDAVGGTTQQKLVVQQ